MTSPRRRRLVRPDSSAWATLLLAGLLLPMDATASDLEKRRAVYETRCAPCHGSGGTGDGPAAAAITPKPRNFRDAQFWKGRTREQLRLVVKQGRPGTLMAPFEGVLSEAEIDDVVAYLESFRPAGP